MNRIFVFLGFALSVFFLFQFYEGDIGVNDIFKTFEVQENGEGKLASATAQNSDLSGSPSATILFDNPIDETATNALLDLIDLDVDTFVVIAGNSQNQGRYDIVTKKTDYPDILLDQELITEITKTESIKNIFGTSTNAFYKDSSINGIFPYLGKNFRNAKILPLLVKESVSSDDLKNFTDTLISVADKLDRNIYVINLNNFSAGLTDLAKNFHEEFITNIFANFDKTALSKTDAKSRASLELIFEYAEKSGMKKTEITDTSINFYDGENGATPRKLTITAFGDMMLGRYVRVIMDEKGLGYIFQNIAGQNNNFFSGSDYLFANLEGPIHGEGKKGGTAMVFSFNQDIAQFLKNYGFNILSITNNHAMDQGIAGREETVSVLDNTGVGWCGHPSDADYNSVYFGKIQDKKIAFVCFQDVTAKLDDAKAVELISSLKETVDYLIVSIHWGYEYKHSPDFNTQISPGRAFIDAGADFVIGHHPHVVQSFEIYNGKFIFYSLGNFVFDQYWSEDTQEELGIGIVLEEDDDNDTDDLKSKIYLFPMKSELSSPRLLDENEYKVWIEEFIGYSEYDEATKEMIRNGVVSTEVN